MAFIRKIARSASDYVLSFIAPKICLICENLITEDGRCLDYMCNNCNDKIPFFNTSEDLTARLVGKIPQNDINIDKSIALMDIKKNDKYMDLIYELKYNNYRKIAYELGKKSAIYMEMNHFTDFDAVVPVPIHSAKKRERGYNQSDYIAKAIAEHFEKPHYTNVAKRTVYTESQTKLAKESRSANVIGIYNIEKPQLIAGKNILICDDVFTTGSTINSLATALKQAGATRILSATIAVA